MRPDSPDPIPPENPSAPIKPAKEGTEHDLWDMEFEDGEGAAHASKSSEEIASHTGVPTSVPEKRVSESHIESKIPSERKIVAPVVQPKDDQGYGEYEPKDAEQIKDVGDVDAHRQDTEIPSPEHSPKRNFPSLTKSEKIGLLALIAVLSFGVVVAFVYFSKVPTRPLVSEKIDLPIEGKIVKVTTLSTFWREPMTGGSDSEVVRRGTKLIPVLIMDVEAQSAAIRVLFRNEDGLVIGDPINRTVSGKAKLTIPATAGFDDIGMHAAYRTGGSLPWKVEVLEAPKTGLSIDKYSRLLESEISTDIR